MDGFLARLRAPFLARIYKWAVRRVVSRFVGVGIHAFRPEVQSQARSMYVHILYVEAEMSG
jgi:hypothetical protein